MALHNLLLLVLAVFVFLLSLIITALPTIYLNSLGSLFAAFFSSTCIKNALYVLDFLSPISLYDLIISTASF